MLLCLDMFNTIVALATPPLKSALAIIRVSGDDCFDIVSKVFSKDIRDIKERTLLVGKIVDKDNIVDDVVIAVYKGPKSFTGEDLVEIICHGSMLIANQIISLLLKNGAVLATNGEYSQRAFLHQKIDLVQAEAINDVINSISNEAKELSLLSLKGDTSILIEKVKSRIADILSLIEVNIDFPEYEDIEQANKTMIINVIDEIHDLVDKLVSDGEKAQIITNGIKTAIVGKPNVGKSSLLNALLGEEKAIVTSIEGTTRDVVEGTANLDGIILHLLDTAGIRESDNVVENIGVSKSKDTIKEADLVLVVLDSSKELTEQDKEVLELSKDKNRIIVCNKSDIKKIEYPDAVFVSAKNIELSDLKNAIKNMYGITDKTFKQPALNNARQIGLLKKTLISLDKAKQDAQNDLPVDLISVNLNDAYNTILEILGENVDADFSKEIFKRFCVGK